MAITRITAALVAAAWLLSAAQTSLAAVFTGQIKEVLNDHIVLTVKNKDHRIFVGDKTVITLDGKNARLADLRPGFRTTASARLIGTKLTASSISARSINRQTAAGGAAMRQTRENWCVRFDRIDPCERPFRRPCTRSLWCAGAGPTC